MHQEMLFKGRELHIKYRQPHWHCSNGESTPVALSTIRQLHLLLELLLQIPLGLGGSVMPGCRRWLRPLVLREQPATSGESTCFIHASEWRFSAQNINSGCLVGFFFC